MLAMQSVTWAERLLKRVPLPQWLRPAMGGILVTVIALLMVLVGALAAATALALAAREKKFEKVLAWRASGRTAQPVDLFKRDGFIAHLASLEPQADCAAALPAFVEALRGHGEIQSVIITHPDAVDDGPGRCAWAPGANASTPHRARIGTAKGTDDLDIRQSPGCSFGYRPATCGSGGPGRSGLFGRETRPAFLPASWAKAPGGDLLSHSVSRAVPSAVEGLTSGFGMEPGVSPLLWPPEHIEFSSPRPNAGRVALSTP